jgi:hypothetical protein
MDPFWFALSSNWKMLYKLIQRGSPMSLLFIERHLPEEYNLHISLTYNKINNQELDIAYGLVVMYISPNNCRDNISYMNELYDKRVTLPNLLVVKYSAFHPQGLISEILYDDIEHNVEKDIKEKDAEKLEEKDIKEKDKNIGISYEVFKVHCLHGYSERLPSGNPKPTMNLVITCPKTLLEQKKVVFMDKNEKKSERNVWMFCGNNPGKESYILDRYLLEVLGEYNMLLFVSYIEIVPSEDASPEIEYMPLESLRDELELVMKSYEPPIKKCSYCQISEIQTDLIKCECKKFYFCSVCVSTHKCK